MSDLELEIEQALHIYDQTPHFVWWKDSELRYELMNDQTAKMCGYKSSKISYEKVTDHDFPIRVCELADDFAQQDRLVMRSKQKLSMFNFGHYGDNSWRMVLAHKFPRYDKDGAVIGMSGTGIDVTDCPLMRTALMLLSNDDRLLGIEQNDYQQFTYMIKSTYEDFNLTQRESECLFLLLRGKTNKEIASTLGINARTIEKYIDRLKLKMQCYRRSQLVEKALESGAGNIIPKTILAYTKESMIND